MEHHIPVQWQAFALASELLSASGLCWQAGSTSAVGLPFCVEGLEVFYILWDGQVRAFCSNVEGVVGPFRDVVGAGISQEDGVVN